MDQSEDATLIANQRPALVVIIEDDSRNSYGVKTSTFFWKSAFDAKVLLKPTIICVTVEIKGLF